MKKNDLRRLLFKRDFKNCDVRTNDPQLWSAILAEQGDRLRTWVLDTLKTSAPEVRERIANLDFSGVASANVVQFVRDSLEKAGFDPRLIQDTVETLQGIPRKRKSPADDCRPLSEIPEIALQLEKARLFEITDISKLDDATAEKIAAELSGPSGINNATLAKFIDNGRLTKVQAAELGFAAALYQLADEHAALATVMRNLKPGWMQGKAPASTKDLFKLGAADWAMIIGENNDPLPKGVTRERAAIVLADRIAALHPDLAFVARLPKPDSDVITAKVENLQPLFAKNPKVLGLEFKDLNTEGLAPEQIKQLEVTHAELQALVRAYPGLRLAEVIDDLQLTPKDKAATIARRQSFVEKVHGNLKEGELFELDYSPDSPDLEKLDMAGIGADADEQAMVLETLKAHQRSYALTRHVDDAQYLLRKGFTSSKDIALKSFSVFQTEVDFDASRARRYWTDARYTFLDSTLALGSIIDVRWGLFDNLRVSNVNPDIQDYLKRLGGYETLFGSLLFCSCNHCQSILGPAAYFVDLMKFVDENIRTAFDRADHPLDLKTRRPDLWTLDISCACKDERIPTVDIVNEVLENFTARAHGFAGSWTDRAAVSRVVYERTLIDTANSFSQPFHLQLARVDAYLAKLETSRRTTAHVLGASGTDYAAAALCLSPQEFRRISRRDVDLGHLGQIYGITFRLSGSTIAAADAQELLARMGLSREELGQLFSTVFVTAGGASVSIVAERRSADSVQNDIENVHGLTADALDRIHRFARLWKKLPWSIAELDRVLVALADSTLAPAALASIARVRDVEMQLGTSPDETCALFGLLPRSPSSASLFDRLFNPPSIVVTDGAFPKDSVHFIHPAFRSAPPAEADPALPRLLAGLRIDLDGLGQLVKRLAPYLESEVVDAASGTRRTEIGFDPSAPNEGDRHFLLSVANLTLLYRHARLAQALGLSIDELFQLIAFTGLPGHIRNLDDLVQLLAFHDWWKDSGYRLDDIAVATGVQPSDASRYPDALVSEIVSGASDALTFNDTVFAVALGITEKASRDFFSANPSLNPTLFEATAAGQWRLADGIDLATATVNIPHGTTIPVPPRGSRPMNANDVQGVLGSYRSFVVLRSRLAAAFGIEPEKAEALAKLAGRDLVARDLAAALRGEGAATPVRDLIAGLIPYSIAFRSNLWNATALEWLRQHPDLFGLPATGPTVATLRAASVYTRLASRRTGTTADSSPVDAADVRAAFQAFDSTTSTFPSAVDAPLARVLGVSPGLVLGLRSRVRPGGTAAIVLGALAEACGLAESLGIDGETTAAIAGTDYDGLAHAADALAAAYGSRFADEAERQRQLSVLEEPVRERKRDALVAYLVYSLTLPQLDGTEQRPFQSPDELYEYFLIDVQAGGCSTTSCIVSAISSVQLYVQRVMMNLEQDRREPSDPEHLRLRLPDDAASQWTWRKNYRVWEANRKVFLWPENYIEPDLRDDKTPLFKELESELLQTDITDQNVLDAYTKYLKGFEEVASLTIAGAYHDVRVAGEHTTDILHLFGAASSDPPIYYYRTCEGLIDSGRNFQKAAVWTPWRRIDVQISGRRVSPVVYLGRLHLFWTEFKTRPLNQIRNGSSEFTGYQHTMRVKFTTLCTDDAWTPPQTVELPADGSFGPGRGLILDRLNFAGWPKFGNAQHLESIDDYTIAGPNWDWLWLGPFGGDLQVVYRNFIEQGKVDVFARRIERRNYPIILYPQARKALLHADGVALYYALPDPWVSYTPGMANAIIEGSRRDFVIKDDWGLWDRLGLNLHVQQIATLQSGTTLLALPGNVEDAILQVGEDVILLQGSVTRDNRYVLRRLGTDSCQRRFSTALFDGCGRTLVPEYATRVARGCPATDARSRIHY